MNKLFSSFDLGKVSPNNVPVKKSNPQDNLIHIKEDTEEEEEEEEELVPSIVQKTSSGISSRIIDVNIEIENEDLEPGNIRNNIIKILNKNYLYKVINNVMIIELELMDDYFNLCYDREDNFKTLNVSIKIKEKYYCVGEEIECSFSLIDGNLIGTNKDVICYLSYQGIINQKINNEYLLIDKNIVFTTENKLLVKIIKILPSGYCDFFLVEGKIIDIIY